MICGRGETALLGVSSRVARNYALHFAFLHQYALLRSSNKSETGLVALVALSNYGSDKIEAIWSGEHSLYYKYI